MDDHKPRSEQEQQRRQHLDTLKNDGVPLYPNDLRPDTTAAALHERYGETDRETLEGCTDVWRIAGRLMGFRSFGKLAFGHVDDGGGRIQVAFQKDALEPEVFKRLKRLDVGDLIWVEGTPMRTKTGELTINARHWRLAAKCLHPLPEKWHGLTDVEVRYRQRYLDLLMSPEAREVFRRRSRIVDGVRRFFLERDYLEVETPMMHSLISGAAARPFSTHHNALDLDLYLRIAPELHLKRLLVGGFPRVFEINRNFRNEGLDTRHNPEFTMIEFYQAWADFEQLMNLTETLLRGLAESVCGQTTVPWLGHEIDLGRPFARRRIDELVGEHYGLSPEQLANRETLLAEAKKRELEVENDASRDKLLMELYEAEVEETLIQPTFVLGFPREISPLSRPNDQNPAEVDRFELIVAGNELANAFSELNDPFDQADRFRAQLEAKARGEAETMDFDEDYITALEHGMPPAAGEGIGIDRLVMLLTNSSSIRDVILFPQMRPRGKTE